MNRTDPQRREVAGPASEVSYLEWPGDDEQAPLLCLHPVNTAADIWSAVAVRLSRRVIAVDYRGHGRSATGSPVFPVDFAADARAVADALGLGRVHLVAGSIGGAVSVEFTAADPTRVVRISLFGATLHLGFPAEDLDPMLTALRTLGVRDWFARHGSEILGPAAAAGSAERLTELASAGRDGPRDLGTVEANLVTTFGRADSRPTAGRLRDAGLLPPVDVAVGSADPTCPPAMAEAIAALLGGRVTVLQGIGHLPMLEAPERVAKLLAAPLDVR